MAVCGYCGLRDVDTVAAVQAGCNQIDAALERFNEVTSTVGQASSILNHNSLQFGGENAALEQALDELGTMISKSVNANAGLTGQIIAAANAQQAEWEANVRECKRKAEEAARRAEAKKK